MRADQLIVSRVPTTDRSLVRAAFARGWIRINGQVAVKGQRVVTGDLLEIAQLWQRCDRMAQPDASVPLFVIYEDEHLIVLNKPASQPTHPIRIGETGTLVNALLARYPELQHIGTDPMFPALVHRLDTDTSGVIIAARTAAVYEALRTQFHQRKVTKTYLAVVFGHPPPQGRLVHFLAHKSGMPGHMEARLEMPKNSKKRWMRAELEYSVVAQGPQHALLRIQIRTGVTHQVRCQLAAQGYPILGDIRYGSGQETTASPFVSRQMLHAIAITLTHPASGQIATYRAPIPEDFRETLDRVCGPGSIKTAESV